MQGVFPIVCLWLVISVAVQENVGSTTQKPSPRKNNQARKSKGLGKRVSATMVKQLFEMKDKLHSLEDSLQTTRTELESTKSQLSATKTDVESTKSQLNDSKTELESQLNATKIELESTKSQLNAAKTELESQLNDKETELESTKSQLSAAKAELESQLSAARVEAASIKSQLSATRTELESQLSAGRTEAKSTKSQLSATKTELQSQLRAARTEAASIKSQLSAVKHGQGSSFIRWGRKSCPGSTTLVYSGIAGGKTWEKTGSGTNILCLTRTPQFDNTAKHSVYYGLLYGAEYEHIYGLHNREVPCSVCLAPQSSTIMVPATLTCPPGWTPQYTGHLASQYDDGFATEYVCLDGSPEDESNRLGNDDDLLFYYVASKCGSLPCPPYIDGKVLTCVVCSR